MIKSSTQMLDEMRKEAALGTLATMGSKLLSSNIGKKAVGFATSQVGKNVIKSAGQQALNGAVIGAATRKGGLGQRLKGAMGGAIAGGTIGAVGGGIKSAVPRMGNFLPRTSGNTLGQPQQNVSSAIGPVV